MPTTPSSPRGESAPLAFVKIDALRNDFVVVVDLSRTGALLSRSSVVAVCDRRSGVGADGVLSVVAPTTAGAVASMHVTNSDGSVPEMCGNGLRGVARVLVDAGKASLSTPFVIDTDAGPKTVVVTEADVEIDMGHARFVDDQAGVPELDAPITVLGRRCPSRAVSMGNPHLVVDVDASLDDVRREGPILERESRFPHGVNVGFATVVDDTLVLKVWERGAGLTEACGTGACAAAAAFVEWGKFSAGAPISVSLPGGTLVITVDEARRVTMRGPARVAFQGTLTGF